MSDVACLCSAPIVREVRARGLDPNSLVEGLDTTLAELEDPSQRIRWQDFVIFADRSEELLGADTLEDLAAAATLETVPAPLRRVLPWLDPIRLFTLSARWWGPWVFRGTRSICEPLPDGRLRELVEILPGYAPCPAFLSGIRGTLRAMPRLLGQGEAVVSLDQDGRYGEFVITPPPRARMGRVRSVLARGRERKQAARAAHALEEVGFSQEQLLESERRARAASQLLGERCRMLAGLAHLGRAVVQHGDADTLRRAIVQLLRRQLGVSGAVRLSHHGGLDLAARVASVGAPAGPPARSLPLRFGDRYVGSVELWDVAPGDGLGNLEELLQWIAIALESSASRTLTARLLEILAEDTSGEAPLEGRLEAAIPRRDDLRLAPPRRAPRMRRATSPASRPPRTPEAVDLGRSLQALGPRLHQLAGDAVRIQLRCAEGLAIARPGAAQLENLVEKLVEILGEVGAEELWIETRSRSEHAETGTGELLVWGRGACMNPISRTLVEMALEGLDLDAFSRDFEVHHEMGGALWLRIRVPLIAAPGRGSLH